MRIQSTSVNPFSHFVLRGLVLLALLVGMPAPGRAAPNFIQELIDAAPAGGTVVIPAGTYPESLTINKDLTLVGNSAATTFLTPPAGQRGITLGSSAHVVNLASFTISGASLPADSGGAILGQNVSLTLETVTIAQNSALYGGGIFLNGGKLNVSDSVIQGNHAAYHGGGIYANSPMTITLTTVSLNTAGQHGGGVHGNQGKVVLVADIFQSNTAGLNGGGLNMNDDLTIQDTQFISNTAGVEGGGVLQWNTGRSLSLTGVTFSGNSSARSGGGMSARGSLAVTGGRFYRNTAGASNSAQDAFGGGLYLEDGALTLHGTTFQENKALCQSCFNRNGGGLDILNGVSNLVTDAVFQANDAWLGGGLFKSKRPTDPTYGSLTVLRSTFLNNTSGYGGGFYGPNLTVSDSLFEGNTAVNEGGGLLVSITAQLERVRVLRNHVLASGGKAAGMFIAHAAVVTNSVFNENVLQYSGATAVGSGITVGPAGGLVSLQQVTIANNTGGNGAGLMVEEGTITMTNPIIAHQVLGVCVKAGSLQVDGILWHGNGSNTGSPPDCPLAPVVSHAVTGDPLFAADGYHLTSGSAAYNAGVDSAVPADLDGDPRPQFGLFDLGADELVYRLSLPLNLK